MYKPPFTVSAKAINLIAKISSKLERYAIKMEQEDTLRLRRANRIKTIHSSLAIEGNTLSEGEVQAVPWQSRVIPCPRVKCRRFWKARRSLHR